MPLTLLAPLGFLAHYAYAGCDPARMGLGPVAAIEKASAGTGLAVGDADRGPARAQAA